MPLAEMIFRVLSNPNLSRIPFLILHIERTNTTTLFPISNQLIVPWGFHRGGTPSFLLGTFNPSPVHSPNPGPGLSSPCSRLWVQFHGFPRFPCLAAALNTLQLLWSGASHNPCGTNQGTVQSSGLKDTTEAPEPLQLRCSHPVPTEMSEPWPWHRINPKI